MAFRSDIAFPARSSLLALSFLAVVLPSALAACATATTDAPSDAGTSPDATAKDAGRDVSPVDARSDAEAVDSAVDAVSDTSSPLDAGPSPQEAGSDAGPTLPTLEVPNAVGDSARLVVFLSDAADTLPTLRTTGTACPAAQFTGTRAETTYAYVKLVNPSNQPKRVVVWQSPNDVFLTFLELAIYASNRVPVGDAERTACTFGPSGDCTVSPCSLPNSRGFAGIVGASAFTIPAQSTYVVYNTPQASAPAGSTGSFALNVQVVP